MNFFIVEGLKNVHSSYENSETVLELGRVGVWRWGQAPKVPDYFRPEAENFRPEDGF